MIELPKYTCNRCNESWVPRTEDPKSCPKCHSPYWNKPRVRVGASDDKPDYDEGDRFVET